MTEETHMITKHDHTLTFDEKRAAEAAFRGLPIDPTWPVSAQEVYFGILALTQGRNIVDKELLDPVVA
jgi:hypothetical protein